jgi:hypothetical protein
MFAHGVTSLSETELNCAKNSCRQHYQRTDKREHGVDRNAEKPEWQKQNPDERVKQQCCDGNGPARDEQ